MHPGVEVRGIDGPNVTAWFDRHVPDAVPPLGFDLIAGGHSNLTFRVTDTADHVWVLRRPPLFQVLATAHDMAREHRIMAALGPTAVPVPEMLGLCMDESVNERPFYVMSFVDGHVLRTRQDAEALPVATRRAAARSLAEVLASIHAVDVDAVGLGDLGRKEQYVARQLKRWLGQLDASKTEDRTELFEVHAHLVERIPDQARATIVHGDYRLDNCVLDDDGQVLAVLDWELCTLGDPLADVALLAAYWSGPDDQRPALEDPPTAVEGFPDEHELLGWYAEASGTDLGDMDFYLAFAYWRLACILEGVYSRYVNGAMGDKTPPGGLDAFKTRIDGIVDEAVAVAARVP